MNFDEQQFMRKVLRKIEKELNNSFIQYFSYGWREKISEILTTETKYSKLIERINKEIEDKISMANVFCPADKTEDYTNDFFRNYMDAMRDFAVLIHLRELLLDERTTTQMRENIEYTIEKVFGIKYNKFFEDYV